MEIAAILESLERLQAIHTLLLELTKQKRDILIGNRVGELSAIVQKESKLIKQVGESGQLWLKAIADFIGPKGLSADSVVNLTDVVRMLENEQEKNKLTSAQEKLLDTIEELKEWNALNQQLIEQSLAYVNYSLDLVTDIPDQDMVYHNPSHTITGKNARGFFDKRA